MLVDCYSSCCQRCSYLRYRTNNIHNSFVSQVVSVLIWLYLLRGPFKGCFILCSFGRGGLSRRTGSLRLRQAVQKCRLQPRTLQHIAKLLEQAHIGGVPRAEVLDKLRPVEFFPARRSRLSFGRRLCVSGHTPIGPGTFRRRLFLAWTR